VVKPDPKDKNVMPYEMAEYVRENTELGAVVRVGGDLDTIRRFINSGYPVLVEKGTYLTDLAGVYSWMGHYQVVTGYDDEKQEFIAQDSYVGADHIVPYDEMERNWRAFNNTYMIIHPLEDEAEVISLLGEDADETSNYQRAAQRASDEIFALQFSDQFFAWFNRGTNLMYLQDYAGAADAYDNAFAVYAGLDEANRPWRMLWYQTGPYFAYFYSQRYWDVLNLAETTLNQMQSDRNLEESYYWRGMAKAALGDTAGAIEDMRTSLKYHPGFEPALYQLEVLGASP
jgi:tetratricopeptide (TPR) repeat protein